MKEKRLAFIAGQLRIHIKGVPSVKEEIKEEITIEEFRLDVEDFITVRKNVVMETEADSAGEIQLSSPHADDHVIARNEELREPILFVDVEAEKENEPVSNEEDNNCVQQIPNQQIHAETSETQAVPVTSQNGRVKRCNIALPHNGMQYKRTAYNRKRSGDEYIVFGKFVAQELRSLHSEIHRRLLKRKIQKAVLEVSELDHHKAGPHERQ
ncbi:uncharacterized protein LOC110830461 isoform X2 [Zootermopsis nevadensis]|uniref:uncharacterized protein LOC110830461 isoform X2 n=1 Tax=Zootermopsis nevadensis TaxID=136037 RepID=UPI000B8E651A|nr:uncharacterized protein LOC110830461 isoform X2 [Zootermopsis nevadensis]